jgi:hypothetical protein
VKSFTEEELKGISDRIVVAAAKQGRGSETDRRRWRSAQACRHRGCRHLCGERESGPELMELVASVSRESRQPLARRKTLEFSRG